MEKLDYPIRKIPIVVKADVTQRKGETSTFDIRLTAGVAREEASRVLNCMWVSTPDFLSGFTPLTFCYS